MYKTIESYSDSFTSEFEVYSKNKLIGYYVINFDRVNDDVFIEVYHAPEYLTDSDSPKIDEIDFTMIDEVYTPTDAFDMIVSSFEETV